MMMVAVTPTREVLIVDTSRIRVSHHEDVVDNGNIRMLQIYGESSTGDEDG